MFTYHGTLPQEASLRVAGRLSVHPSVCRSRIYNQRPECHAKFKLVETFITVHIIGNTILRLKKAKGQDH